MIANIITTSNATSPKPNLPADVIAFLATCPKRPKAGIHTWLYSAARRLHLAQVDKKEMARLLEAATADCGRVIRAQEIPDATASSERDLRGLGAGHRAEHRPKWPKPNQDRIRPILKDGPDLDYLRAITVMKAEGLIQ
jgi:hypothetical protein